MEVRRVAGARYLRVGRLGIWPVELEASGPFWERSTAGCSQAEKAILAVFYVEYPLDHGGMLEVVESYRPWLDELEAAYDRLGASASLLAYRSLQPRLQELLLRWDAGDPGAPLRQELQAVGDRFSQEIHQDLDSMNLRMKRYFLANHATVRGAAQTAALIYRP